MKELSGRTAFITGGASGIGLGMARTFLAAGIKVAIADVREDHLDTARKLIGPDLPVLYLPLDVTDRDAFQRAADEAEAKLGTVSILCNNAGVGVLGRALDSRYADWDWTLSVNLGGVVNGIQTFLPRFAARDDGHIVNTSSIGGMLPMPGGAPYVASKAAIDGISEALASEFDGSGIGVTLLIPGPTQTNINQVGRLRPAAYADSGLTEFERQLDREPIFAGGLNPLETGRMVLAAIEANRLYLFTHNVFREGVAEHFAAIMTGFEGASDEDYGVDASNPLFARIVRAGAGGSRDG
ncbi:MAG: SDR family NAD(P)-dependent oxidoreductase [Novosphingobium sp.]|nr:SDR family NAD(P)-dependent oxidoreductase [Novosphingobium sp.]MBO9601592.1 SDR family NAD(P)-dependent oxidoreductase [Novosphingobium sp.]